MHAAACAAVAQDDVNRRSLDFYLPASACNFIPTETAITLGGGREEGGIFGQQYTTGHAYVGCLAEPAGLQVRVCRFGARRESLVQHEPPDLMLEPSSNNLHPQLYFTIPCTGRLRQELIGLRRYSRAQKPFFGYLSFFLLLLVCAALHSQNYPQVNPRPAQLVITSGDTFWLG